MATELKPCPFCGKNVAEVGTVAEHRFMDKKHHDYGWANKYYKVVCNYLNGGCGASAGGASMTKEAAIEAWNRRAEDGRHK